ncbi:hypothetical protein CEXT_118481 [Caerostris extrusa]|uniref:Uncharacterized protein n=1 Tax=Caerostris extrusa TaxID=172846 RepID=A0AAV4RFW8_CAEEX|nr:hypothetical protein CEXT_118481 [Caerostris extrusa]
MYLRTVNVKLLCIIWHLLVVVTSTYDTLDSTNEKPSTSLKNLIISSPQGTIEENDEGEKKPFTCMKSENEPCKKRRWRPNHFTRFRKKLVRSLWSTRGCILGLKNDGTQV